MATPLNIRSNLAHRAVIVCTGRQALGLVFGFMRNPETKDQTWDWLKTNFDEFVEARIADVRRPGLPRLGSGFCQQDKAGEVEAFFSTKAPLMPGYERALAQSLESINLCASLRTAKSQELVDALAAR